MGFVEVNGELSESQAADGTGGVRRRGLSRAFPSSRGMQARCHMMGQGSLNWTAIQASLSPELPHAWLQEIKASHSSGALGLPAVTLQKPQPASLRPPVASLPGKRGCSKGHLTQKPRLVENCRDGGPGCGGVCTCRLLHGPLGLAPHPALSSTHCQTKRGVRAADGGWTPGWTRHGGWGCRPPARCPKPFHLPPNPHPRALVVRVADCGPAHSPSGRAGAGCPPRNTAPAGDSLQDPGHCAHPHPHQGALTLPCAGRSEFSSSRQWASGPGRQHRLTWPLTGQAGSQLSAWLPGW